MKLSFKLMLFGLFAMLVAPMFIIKPNGERLMSPSDLLPDVASLKGGLNKVALLTPKEPQPQIEGAYSTGPKRSSGKLYSWRDANGTMHFSESPPEHMAGVEQQRLPRQTNVIKSVEVPGDEGGSAAGGDGFKLAFPTTIPVQDIPKLVDDANAIRSLATERNQTLESL